MDRDGTLEQIHGLGSQVLWHVLVILDVIATRGGGVTLISCIYVCTCA